MSNFVKIKVIAKWQNHALVANFNIANVSFNAIHKNKILRKISEFTVYQTKIVTEIIIDFVLFSRKSPHALNIQ